MGGSLPFLVVLVVLVVVFVVVTILLAVNIHLFSLSKDSGDFAMPLLNKHSGKNSMSYMKSGYLGNIFYAMSHRVL